MELQLKLRQIRAARGLTLREVAEKMQTTGASISRCEREPQRVSVPLLAKFAEVYDCTVDEILGLNSMGCYERTLELVTLPIYEPNTLLEASTNTKYVDFPTYVLPHVDREKFRDFALMVVRGDSMMPSYEDGSVVLIDRQIKLPQGDGIYAIASYGDHAELRWLSVNPIQRTLDLKPENTRYREYLDVKLDQIHVLGRVVWHCRTL